MALLHPSSTSCVIRPVGHIRRRIITITIIVIIVVVPPGKTLSPVPVTGSWSWPCCGCTSRMMLTVPVMLLFVPCRSEVNCGRGDGMFRTTTAVHIETRWIATANTAAAPTPTRRLMPVMWLLLLRVVVVAECGESWMCGGMTTWCSGCLTVIVVENRLKERLPGTVKEGAGGNDFIFNLFGKRNLIERLDERTKMMMMMMTVKKELSTTTLYVLCFRSMFLSYESEPFRRQTSDLTTNDLFVVFANMLPFKYGQWGEHW